MGERAGEGPSTSRRVWIYPPEFARLHALPSEAKSSTVRCQFEADAKLMFDLSVVHRRRRWAWQVRNDEGAIMLHGWEQTRPAARYRGYRALFFLLERTAIGAKRPAKG